ncbi:MAG: phosphoenolpyruvate carboxykinase (ATP) [Synechococcus sp.]
MCALYTLPNAAQLRAAGDSMLTTWANYAASPHCIISGESSDSGVLHDLEALGLHHLGKLYRNLAVPQLVEHALLRGEGELADNGALCVETGQYTGRSPLDRFIVDEPSCHDSIAWNKLNRPISPENFKRLLTKVQAYVQGRDLFIFDGFVGADPDYRQGVRVIAELASQSLFARNLFQRPTLEELADHQPDFTVIAVPGLQGDPNTDGIRSEAFIVLHLERKLVLIGGSRYAGEIKKSVFSMMNYFLTEKGVLPMHGAANLDKCGNSALFFGLSGTGKTTLSADPTRSLIGDDEHGWSADGLFNFEGGCYAKTIRLSKQHEPQIWEAMRFGTLMENVILDLETRAPRYDDARLTENTRAAYPLQFIPNCSAAGVCSHPRAVIFLTADAFGVLPPIAKLTREEAMYHFLSGYTSKLAGTERGITAPQATFSACFGQVFFPRPATVYADMLGELLEKHHETQVYLVNTGWQGGPYGIGHRIAISHTRAMVSAALNGTLETARFTPHPIFKVLVPDEVPGVPNAILDPKQSWDDPEAYDLQARELARRFAENFRQFEDLASPEIAAAGPSVA